MRCTTTSLRLLVGAAIALAVLPSGSTPIVHAAGGTITGVVRDSQGAPIPNATVRAMVDTIGFMPRVTVTADANGAFTITGLTPAVYRLGAVATGFAARYANADDWAHATAYSITGATTLSGDITLFHPTATVSGRIVDDHGDPVVGATVGVGLDWPMGMSPLATYDHFGRQVVTGADGSYSVSGLTSGAMRMNVTSPSPTLIGGFYSTLRGPGTPFQVAEGATVTGIDLTLPHSGTVTGRITDSSGAPVAGANVLVGGWDTPHQTVSASDGTYTITGVEPGPQWLLAQLYPSPYLTTYYGQTTYGPEAVEFTVTSSGTTSGIDVELITGIDVVVHLPDAPLPTSSFRYVRGCRAPGTPIPAPQAPNPQLDCSNTRPAGEQSAPDSNGDVVVRFPVGDYQLQAIFVDHSSTGTASLRVTAGSAPVCTLRISGASSCTPSIPAPPVTPPPSGDPPSGAPATITEIGLELTSTTPYRAAARLGVAGSG
jgi:hypothetical protein